MESYEDTLTLNEVELNAELIVLHRSWVNEVPLILFIVVSIVAGIYLTVLWPSSVQTVHLYKINLPIPLFALLPVVLMFLLWHRLFNDKYAIDIDHVLGITGILSFNMKDQRLDYQNIRGIEIKRSMYQRILDLGNIHIGSSMYADVEIIMIGIRNPSLYRGIMEDRIRNNFKKLNIKTENQVGNS